MTIPEVRARLDEIAGELQLLAVRSSAIADELQLLGAELKRRRHRVVPQTARSMSRALAAQIREYARDHPWASELDVANAFGVNQGRVSEALYGKRT